MIHEIEYKVPTMAEMMAVLGDPEVLLAGRAGSSMNATKVTIVLQILKP
jgi:hypothetical protein